MKVVPQIGACCLQFVKLASSKCNLNALAFVNELNMLYKLVAKPPVKDIFYLFLTLLLSSCFLSPSRSGVGSI